MTHEIGPALRTVTIHEAFAVYKDYDGNCPDGPVFAICATEALAKEVADLLGRHDPNQKEEGEEDTTEHGVDWDELGWPGSEGWEWSACWRSVKTEAEHGKIATTLSDALKQVAAT